MSDPPSDVEVDPYPLMAKWRQSERAQMIKVLRDMIQEAGRMVMSKRAPASQRIRWTRLAGQLIWYKDSILRSMTLESMEREMIKLKDEVFLKKEPGGAPPGYELRPPPPFLLQPPSPRPVKPSARVEPTSENAEDQTETEQGQEDST